MTSQISAGHLMEEVSGQVGGAELYQVRSLTMPVSFEAGVLESVKSVEMTGRALRAIKEGRGMETRRHSSSPTRDPGQKCSALTPRSRSSTKRR
jgi:predicted Zn-dependent protease